MLYLSSDYNRAVQYEKSALFVAKEGFRHKKRQIANYEILFVTKGTLYYQEGERQYVLRPGDVFIASPNVTHFGYAPSEEGTRFFWVHYFLSDPLAVTFDNGFFHMREDTRLILLFKQLLHAANSHLYPFETLNHTVALILAEIALFGVPERDASLSPMEAVAHWIRTETDGRLVKLSDVEEHFGVKESELRRDFYERYRMTVNDYILSERLALAKRYLVESSIYVKEIAARLGYPRVDHFVKFFKYHEHVTPGAFRNGYYNTLMHNK